MRRPEHHSETTQVYVPIRGNNAVAGSTAKVCSKGTDAFGLAGSDALGCILSYIAPTDSDDDPPAKKTKQAKR
jgi:hypothetical protein